MILQVILLKYTITQNLGNAARMCTTTPAMDTRPFFPHSALIEKKRPGDEAIVQQTLQVKWPTIVC